MSQSLTSLPVEKDEVGRKIDYPGLTYAPINEQGVVLLFGMMSDDLGFSVEAIRSGFPDALVVDYRANPNRGVKKYIEFEFQSSHFSRQKGHDPKKCNIIICWEHDWANHPKDIEIIQLKSLIQNLKHAESEQIAHARISGGAVKTKPAKPDYETSWNARIDWVHGDTRALVRKLTERLETQLPGLRHQPRYRWLSFYRGEPFVRKNECATLLIGRKTVRLSIRVNPQ